MKEPLQAPNSLKWLDKIRKMQTIFLDEEVVEEMKEPH